MFRHCRSGLLQKAIDDRDRFLTRAQNTAQIFFSLLEFGFLLFGFSADCGQLGLYFRRGGFVIEGLLQGFDCGAGVAKEAGAALLPLCVAAIGVLATAPAPATAE